MTLERPWLLVLLVPALLSLWPAVRSRARLSGRRRALSTGARALTMSAFALALAGFGAGAGPPPTTVFAIDASDSVLLSEQANAVGLVDTYARATGGTVPIGVVEFGARASVAAAPGRIESVPDIGRGVPGNGTDLGAGLASALSLMPAAGGQIVLVSDGNATRGNTDIAIQAAQARGVRISVAPVRGLRGTDLAVETLRAPSARRLGSPVQVRVAVRADRLTTARLRIWDGVRLVSDGPIQLRPGIHQFAVDLDALALGFHRLRAEVLEDADLRLGNNVAETFVRVVEPGRALSVTRGGDASPFALALAAAGVAVTHVAAADLAQADLTRVDALLIADVPAEALGEAAMLRVRDWVRAGGGLFVSGGPASFAAGGYEGTPLDDLLPVWSNPTENRPEPRLALVLVIDKSSSMAGGATQGNAKIDLALEAAVEAVSLLEEGDILGVLAFDIDSQWVVPPRAVASGADLQRVIDRIRGIQIGSSTDLFRAMFSARARLQQVEASVKHVVLLTDGRALYGDFDALARAMRRNDMTVSTIAIGQDADRELLERIARLGNGRSYFTADPRDVPQVLTQETRLAGDFAIVERQFQPRLTNPSPIFSGRLDGRALAELQGFVRTRAKPTAEVILASDSNDPILAQWQFGRGRAVAWTSDAGQAWATAWAADDTFATFARQVVDWVMPPADAPRDGLFVTARLADERGLVSVDAVDADGAFVNGADLAVNLIAADGVALALPVRQTAPGRYAAPAPPLPAGVYEIRAAAAAGGALATATSGLVIPAAAEAHATAPDLAELRRIAAVTGGRVIDTPAELATLAVRRAAGPALTWGLLVTVGLIFFVIDVGIRRVRGSPREVWDQLRDVRTALGRGPHLTIPRGPL